MGSRANYIIHNHHNDITFIDNFIADGREHHGDSFDHAERVFNQQLPGRDGSEDQRERDRIDEQHDFDPEQLNQQHNAEQLDQRFAEFDCQHVVEFDQCSVAEQQLHYFFDFAQRERQLESEHFDLGARGLRTGQLGRRSAVFEYGHDRNVGRQRERKHDDSGRDFERRDHDPERHGSDAEHAGGPSQPVGHHRSQHHDEPGFYQPEITSSDGRRAGPRLPRFFLLNPVAGYGHLL